MKFVCLFLIFATLNSCKVYTLVGDQKLRNKKGEVSIIKEEIKVGSNVILRTIYDSRLSFKVEAVTDSTIVGNKGYIIKFSEIDKISKVSVPVTGYEKPVKIIGIIVIALLVIIPIVELIQLFNSM